MLHFISKIIIVKLTIDIFNFSMLKRGNINTDFPTNLKGF